MLQYQEAKRANPDCLIMLRMGDFYEMFYEDAITAARELEITLTARGTGEKRAPLAGVPFHALDVYLGRLIKKGHKIAIIEQLEDPKKSKGLVKRGLVRIVTPGTVIESSMLDEKENNYIMGLTTRGEEIAAAFCDVSTGEFFTANYSSAPPLLHEMSRLLPRECIIPESLKVNQELLEMIQRKGCFLTTKEDYFFRQEKGREILCNHFNVKSLDAFGLEDKPGSIAVCGGLLHYLQATQKTTLAHLKKIFLTSNNQTMMLDSSTFRNLELIHNMKDGSHQGTLLSILDKTITAMGSRLLKKWVKAPLLQRELIQQRLEAIELLSKKIITREELSGFLKEVSDLERVLSRVTYGTATPREVLSLKQSLQKVPFIKEKAQSFQESSLLKKISTISAMEELAALLEEAIHEDAPVTTREGGIFKTSFHLELNELYALKTGSKHYLQKLEEEEKKKTGIPNLRISYNHVFGYFIEITKKNLHRVPEGYIRKQTTATAERYITEELKIEEEKILGAEEKIQELEYTLFQEILQKIAEKTEEIQNTAFHLAVLDVLCSLSKVALENEYCKPRFVEESIIQIRKGRHPIVEKTEKQFIANDLILYPGEMMVITGPNMAGKSTIMRQTALIVLMAQIGSFVPAEECVLSLVDRIFTRVGAHDDLSSGQSTFLVEMNETANILHNATENSLIVLDEIGRGTSTFDGVSIAWSVAEHLHHKVKAKTLFATHYHVLNKLAEKCSRIKNYNIAVKEVQGELIFLHKLVEGGTDQSYGIQVAKLAGVPEEIIARAQEIQSILEKDDEMMRKMKVKRLQEQKGLEEFGRKKI